MSRFLSSILFSLSILVAASMPVIATEVSTEEGELIMEHDLELEVGEHAQAVGVDGEEAHAEEGGHHVMEFAVPSQTFLYVTAGLFVLAIAHTFMVGKFGKLAHKYPEGSVMENLFHLLGEVEAVFVIWSGLLIIVITAFSQWGNSVAYLQGLNYTEPLFVFVIMIVAATRPVIDIADWFIRQADKVLPMKGSPGFLATVMIIGPLLGSVITEPAAMTVTALILLRGFFSRQLSMKFKYAALAVLFVNVSIGGSLTNFAAPPVIIVAGKWGWDLSYMMLHFGWKAAIAVVINAYGLAYYFKKELEGVKLLKDSDARGKEAAEMKTIPFWVSMSHILFLAFIVLNAHYPAVFLGGFVFFLGFATVTSEYQENLKLKESLLVGGFLAGLITLGSLQKWWIQPVIEMLGEYPLFIAALALTSITDNAALTFLASQVENLSEVKKYMVVAGALGGGGLTVIANAPNPAGFSVLNKSFGHHGINPINLLLAALLPTLVAVVCFLFLPTL